MSSQDQLPQPYHNHNQDDPSDPFATLLTLEDTYFTEGYTLGITDGTRAGLIEGRIFGLEKGFTKALEMGRLHGRAEVWNARLSPPISVSGQQGLKPLKGAERLRRHVERLGELTDPESLECKNGEDEVNEFDERLAGARAKFTLVSRIVGEGEVSAAGTASPPASPTVAEGQEVEITRARVASPRPQREATEGRRMDETSRPIRVPDAAAARRAAPEF